MSTPLFADDVLFTQRILACAGMYAGKLDGAWGPKTDAASREWDSAFVSIRTELGEFDGRSEGEIRTIVPAAQRLCRLYLRAVRAKGLDVRILSGTRTYAAQDALYLKGRNGEKGGTVTNARAGQSNHNFGLAWDVGIFTNGRYLTDSPLYMTASVGRPSGIEWGGDWASLKDRPHYQLATGLSLSAVRQRFEAGVLRIATAGVSHAG